MNAWQALRQSESRAKVRSLLTWSAKSDGKEQTGSPKKKEHSARRCWYTFAACAVVTAVLLS